MLIYTHGKETDIAQYNHTSEAPAIFFISMEEDVEASLAKIRLPIALPKVDESASNRFECREGYDILSLNIPDKSDEIEAMPINIDIYCTSNRILFLHDSHPAIDAIKEKLREGGQDFDTIVPAFLNQLTATDTEYLEEIEMEIAVLEDDITQKEGNDYLQQISGLRKRLLKLKRYHESLLDSLEDMEENQNHLLGDAQRRTISLIAGRADRQLRSVLNLRDYVTQVRESFQAQMDIRMNKIMQLFTVITAIFLPLTVLAGWYGMNLKMPEYEMEYAYPVMIGVAAVMVIGIAAYFRKNKWF